VAQVDAARLKQRAQKIGTIWTGPAYFIGAATSILLALCPLDPDRIARRAARGSIGCAAHAVCEWEASVAGQEERGLHAGSDRRVDSHTRARLSGVFLARVARGGGDARARYAGRRL